MAYATDALQLALGIAMLVAGGEAMVRGAAALARQLSVPPLVIGLTVVAFGTSAPELAVNLTAAIRGNGELAFGNLIGSNLANVGLILGASALLRPLRVESIVITREIPMMLLASSATLLLGLDVLRQGSTSSYDRLDGLLLLLLFALFLYYTIGETLRRWSRDPFVQQARQLEVGVRLGSLGTSGALVGIGLVGLMLGGRLAVDGAVGLATTLGAPKALVGLTIVAVGTSLPELSASLIAARKGETELAIGNVVGSNIFNLLFVLGLTATIRSVPVPMQGYTDLAAMLMLACALLPLSFGDRGIGRVDGALLLIGYLGYVVWRAS